MTLALLTAAYIAAGRLSLLLAFANENASPVWPPTGLAIGALLVLGLRRLAGDRDWRVCRQSHQLRRSGRVAGDRRRQHAGSAGRCLADSCASRAAAPRSTRRATSFALSSLRPVRSAVRRVDRRRRPWWLLVWARRRKTGAIWLTWWLGDTVGAIVVAPLIVLWDRRPLAGRRRQAHRRDCRAAGRARAWCPSPCFSPWPPRPPRLSRSSSSRSCCGRRSVSAPG